MNTGVIASSYEYKRLGILNAREHVFALHAGGQKQEVLRIFLYHKKPFGPDAQQAERKEAANSAACARNKSCARERGQKGTGRKEDL